MTPYRHVLSTELPAETIAVGYFDEREDPTTTTKRPIKPTNSLINLEPNGDSVFVNLSWDNWSGPDETDQSNPQSENLQSSQNLVESSSNKIENSLALDSSSGSVSS